MSKPTTFYSWNIHGINSAVKRAKVIDFLRTKGADICLLQESHLIDAQHISLKTEWFNQIYFSSFNSKQRGVVILINKNTPFYLKCSISDPEGRYIIINGILGDENVTIANIYGPNNDTPTFFHEIFSEISKFPESKTIIGGDFNTVLNSSLDRSTTPSNYKPLKSSEIIKQYMNEIGLADVWRIQNPIKREYSFFSAPHNNFSRIDFFLVNNSVIQRIYDTTIHPIILSDHAAISFKYITRKASKPPGRWRFNISLLQDAEFNAYFHREWSSFLELNEYPGSSPTLIWETAKAVLRGKIISYSSYKKKKESLNQCKLEQELKQCEQLYSHSPTGEVKRQLEKIKLELNKIINKKNEFIALRLRQSNFEYGGKTGKFLSEQLKRNVEKSLITGIRDSSDNIMQTQEGINTTFTSFYSHLYSNQNQSNAADIKSFLDRVKLSKLTMLQSASLDNPLSSDEIEKSLYLMANNKSPGADGYPIEFYKHFWPLISTLFSDMVTEIYKSSCIPHNMNTALISVLLKPNKDPTLCSSYRPLSLINTDLKIISKALAMRLESVIGSLIHHDQTGFIKNRHSSDNTRRLFSLINLANRNNIPTVIASLDAEKAFDKVSWSYLFTVLEYFGFGQFFINWIKFFYNSPKASVITNGYVSQPFELFKGTRQGCPMSPYLFAIFIEPLAAMIRQNPIIEGIPTSSMTHKISLYADDILLFIQNPSTSLPEVLRLINQFSKISDYTINWSKSEILPLKSLKKDPVTKNLPLRWTSSIKYLGIHTTANLSDLFSLNHVPLLKNIEDDLKRWTKLPLSLIGRISTIKMNVLPKMNYYFSMIPVYPNKKWFSSVDSAIIKFYWKDETPRIRLTTLQNSKELGGLNAPDFLHYFLAIQLQYVHKWLYSDPLQLAWLNIEDAECIGLSIKDLPYMTKSIQKHECFKNISISVTLRAWWKCNEVLGYNLALNKSAPIWSNPDFLINKKTIFFKLWNQQGITHIHHLFDSVMFQFDELKIKYDLKESCQYQYIQLKHVLQPKITTFSKSSPLIHSISTIHSKKQLSQLYKIISSKNQLSVPIVKWEKDLDIKTDALFWRRICNNIFSASLNSNIQLIQYKVIHRAHLTQHKLYKMGFFDADVCNHCALKVPDNYFHAIWQCPPVNVFWKTITDTLTLILGHTIPLAPHLCILGDLSTLQTPLKNPEILLLSLIIAKKHILLNWKYKKKLSMNGWTTLMTDYLSLERMTTTSHNRSTQFKEKWEPFENFFS